MCTWVYSTSGLFKLITPIQKKRNEKGFQFSGSKMRNEMQINSPKLYFDAHSE